MHKRTVLLVPTIILILASCARAQSPGTQSQQAAVEDDSTVLIGESWSRLENSLNGTKNTDTRIAAITALSLLGGDARAEGIIRKTMHDSDIDVRLSAIVAAGEMAKAKDSRGDLPGDLRAQLNDPDPKVAFTAASTLWKLDDPSGEDILEAVAVGERSGEYSALKSSKHTVNRTLHSPSALAKIAAQQTLVLLVPPVGIGMGAYGYLKGSGGVSPQITSITQLQKERTQPVKNALIAATKAKDAGACLAAAEALATCSGTDTRDALGALLDDSKESVRLTASAAYIHVSSGLGTPTPAATPASAPASDPRG